MGIILMSHVLYSSPTTRYVHGQVIDDLWSLCYGIKKQYITGPNRIV